jgi:hypothetical protein
MSGPDITVTLVLHREGTLALPALASLADMVKTARAAARAVESQVLLDRADATTRHIVAMRESQLDKVEEVSFGDLGLTRNAGARLACGRFLSFLDGDDLWGDEWLRAAFAAAADLHGPRPAVWHPQYLYVFGAPTVGAPPEATRSFYSLMHASDELDPASPVFANPWSANVFAERELHLRFPYRAADRERGLGIEDWSWNLETLAAGIHHGIVPNTVHLIRRRIEASLDRQNMAEGLLPYLPDRLAWRRDLP